MKQLLFLIVLIFASCEPAKEEVDLIVTNANTYTVDASFSKAEAFAIKDGKFVAVGTTAAITEGYDATTILDAGGSTITPGLIDAHCHFYRLGLGQQNVDLVGTTSYEEVLNRVKLFQEKNPQNFIQGGGWDQNDWEVKEFPNKDALDALFPDTPVALRRVDGHALLVNQKALDLAGITSNTQTSGGEIVKKDGKLTGILVDNPMSLISAVIPEPTITTKIQALKDAEKLCVEMGLTTVDDAGLDRETIELIDSLQQAGELSIRVYAMVSNTKENLDHYLSKGIVKTDHLNVRSVKVYGDGALGSRGAALRDPYTDKEGHYGAMITPVDAIESLASRIAASDYQMNTHAIGDSANIVVLRAYKKVLEATEDRRWRIEHAQVISPEDFKDFSANIIPSVQPTHATSDMYWAEDRLGADRVKGAYAFKTLLDKSGTIALGTDFPVEHVSPFYTFYAAAVEGYQMQDVLSREETLKGMTIWAAHANFEETEKGSIEVGKWADFTILSNDIMEVPANQIPELKAEKTYIAGELVFEQK